MKTELRLVVFGKREPGRSIFLNLFRTYYNVTLYDPTLRQAPDFKSRRTLVVSEDGSKIRLFIKEIDSPKNIFCQGWTYFKNEQLPNDQNHFHVIHVLDFSNNKVDKICWALLSYEIKKTVNALVLALDCYRTDIGRVYKGFMHEINHKFPEIKKRNLVVVFNRCIRDDSELQLQMADVIGRPEMPENHFFFKDLYECDDFQEHFRYNLGQMKALVSYIQRLPPLIYIEDEEVYKAHRYCKPYRQLKFKPKMHMYAHPEEEDKTSDIPIVLDLLDLDEDDEEIDGTSIFCLYFFEVALKFLIIFVIIFTIAYITIMIRNWKYGDTYF